MGWFKRMQEANKHKRTERISPNIDGNDLSRRANEQLQQRARVYEANSRLRVLQESGAIIEKTNNIDTLLLRISDVFEHLDWCSKNNITLTDKSNNIVSHNKAKSDSAKRANEVILRVARFNVEKHNREIHTLKTERGRENRKIKINELLVKCIDSLRENDNKNKIAQAIHDLI